MCNLFFLLNNRLHHQESQAEEVNPKAVVLVQHVGLQIERPSVQTQSHAHCFTKGQTFEPLVKAVKVCRAHSNQLNEDMYFYNAHIRQIANNVLVKAFVSQNWQDRSTAVGQRYEKKESVDLYDHFEFTQLFKIQKQCGFIQGYIAEGFSFE